MEDILRKKSCRATLGMEGPSETRISSPNNCTRGNVGSEVGYVGIQVGEVGTVVGP